jgi:hypothetical protein
MEFMDAMASLSSPLGSLYYKPLSRRLSSPLSCRPTCDMQYLNAGASHAAPATAIPLLLYRCEVAPHVQDIHALPVYCGLTHLWPPIDSAL